MKQLALPVAHRRWLINAILWSILTPAHVGLALLGSPGGWLLILSVPLTVLTWGRWHATRPPLPSPDYARIAELERELFGVRSKPVPPPGPGSATTAR